MYGYASLLSGGSRSFAEFVAAKSGNLALAPRNVGVVDAAALPLVGASAVQAIDEHIELQRGQKILIHGGASGIGSVAIQLAKFIGAHVATTVSAEDKAYVKELGADEVINYKSEPSRKNSMIWTRYSIRSAVQPRRNRSRSLKRAARWCRCWTGRMRRSRNNMG